MSITGAHVLLYTPEADTLRSVLRDAFGWDHIDAHNGWLVYRLPPAEIAVHPGSAPIHQLSLMCDDINATTDDLRAKGIEFRRDPEDVGWGIQTTMVLPGDVEVLLYEPRHATAI